MAGNDEALDRHGRKLEAAVIAVAKAEGFNYTGGHILAEAVRNPRVAKWVTIAEAAVNAYRKTK